jgi:hypothetical protein
MENRITDIGPRKYDEFYPPVIAKNKGKWLYHESCNRACWSMWPNPATKSIRYAAAAPA